MAIERFFLTTKFLNRIKHLQEVDVAICLVRLHFINNK